jgi:hypothetical protein
LCALTTDDKPAYDQMLASATGQDAIEVAAVTNATPPKIFTLNDLTNPTNRFFVPTSPTNSRPMISFNRIGEDILISNVISFEVKFTGTGTTGTAVWPTPLASGNLDWPYDNLPSSNGFNGTFDTNNASFSGAPSAKVRITGVQIRLRAHDPKSHTTRQTTLIVDL